MTESVLTCTHIELKDCSTGINSTSYVITCKRCRMLQIDISDLSLYSSVGVTVKTPSGFLIRKELINMREMLLKCIGV